MLVTQLYPTLCDPIDCSTPGSSVHGILHARILEWVVISFSRGSSQPRDQTQVSCIAGRFFTIWATREALRFKVYINWGTLQQTFKLPLTFLIETPRKRQGEKGQEQDDIVRHWAIALEDGAFSRRVELGADPLMSSSCLHIDSLSSHHTLCSVHSLLSCWAGAWSSFRGAGISSSTKPDKTFDLAI